MILLASRSPQRRALLGALRVPFRVVVSGAAEGDDPGGQRPREGARRRGPGRRPAGRGRAGRDTEVLLDGRALGKPPDAAAARAGLAALAGGPTPSARAFA